MITATSKLVTEKHWQLIIFVTNILDFRKNPSCRRITFRRNILCIFLCDWFVDIIICRKVCRSMLHRTHVVSALTVAVLLQLYNSASSPRTIPPFSELSVILLIVFTQNTMEDCMSFRDTKNSYILLKAILGQSPKFLVQKISNKDN